MNGDETEDTTARPSDFQPTGTGRTGDSNDSDSEVDRKAVAEFQFDQVVRRGDERVTRSVEWSFERGGASDGSDHLASDGGVERNDADEGAKTTGPDDVASPSEGFTRGPRRRSTTGDIGTGAKRGGASDATSERGRDVTGRAAGRVRATWHTRVGGPVGTPPVVRDRTVYAGTGDGTTVALDRRDGVSEWLFETPTAVGPTAVTGEAVYVGDRDGVLHALDASSGVELWRFETDAGVDVAPVPVGDDVYVASRDGRVSVLDAANGDRRRSFRTVARAVSSLTVADDAVYVTGLDGGLYAHEFDGTERFRFRPSLAVAAAPAVVDGVAYVGTVDGDRVFAVDAATGDAYWEHRTGAGVWSSPVFAGDAVYATSTDGSAYALDARTGSVRWRVATDARIWGRPAVTDEAVYVANDDGLTFAFDRATGRTRWRFLAQDGVVAGPAVGRHAAYVGDVSGTVSAIPL
ncbi:Pyrrolo-quinoline quinone [halophilic archaeon]|nr:Pyrrolo-quinoline quinone [halophilic archaeon]